MKREKFRVRDDLFEFGLKPNVAVIYMCMCSRADRNKGNEKSPDYEMFEMSYREIAEKAGVSQTTAVKAVKLLEEKGLIKKHRRCDSSGGNVENLYGIVLWEETK